MDKTVFALVLVGVFEVKHLLCDFFLQTDRHIGKFAKTGWVRPLADHCIIHAVATAAIVLVLGKLDLLWLPSVDFIVHFIMDRIKASPGLLGRYRSVTKEEYICAKETIAKNDTSTQWSTSLIEQAKMKLQNNKYFWYSLGFDQFVHQLTGLFIVWTLVS